LWITENRLHQDDNENYLKLPSPLTNPAIQFESNGSVEGIKPGWSTDGIEGNALVYNELRPSGKWAFRATMRRRPSRF